MPTNNCVMSSTPSFREITCKKYEIEPEMIYTYGTAGFRMNAKLMKPVAFRVGLLAALLSKYHDGKFVGVMITASHNPIEDNGVKLIDPNGEMVIGKWEDLATELANTSDENLPIILNRICGEMSIESFNQDTNVAIGLDTRPSGKELGEIIEFGVKMLSNTQNSSFINLNLQTTPQCHFSIYELNKFGKFGGYIEHFSDKLEKVLNGKLLRNGLVIDAANGIGAQSAELFKNRLKSSIGFNPIIINSGEGVLNHECGADFVKIQMMAPTGISKEKGNKINSRYASLDGDADRLIYFYFDSEGNFKMLDGDRISVLFAFYLRKLLKSVNLLNSLSFGVVQTAYANGASTEFLNGQNISVSLACTGVKNLHHVASKEYDIGVYFEANGHGTVLFNSKASELIEECSNSAEGKKLSLVKGLINQCVGDALSDLLLVELIICEEEISCSTWDSFYTELPSRQLKVKVADRSIFKTVDADTKLINPPNLQSKIDLLVAETPKGRAFVRPSGTEDVVRIYAEAETRDQCDKLAESISKLIQ